MGVTIAEVPKNVDMEPEYTNSQSQTDRTPIGGMYTSAQSTKLLTPNLSCLNQMLGKDGAETEGMDNQ